MTAGLALALVAAVSLGGAARAPTPSEAFRELNAWRAAAGIPPVREFRAAWNQGCALHNRYTQHIGRLEHFEQTSDGFYTPAGDDAARNSELVTIEAGPRRAFIDGVYHRLTVLQPRLRASGFSASYGSTCLRTAGPGVIDDETRTPDLTLYPWPPKGARDQPTTWGLAALELPSPLDDAPGARTLGLLLSVSVNGPWATSLDPRSTVTQASLVADGGKPVPLAISDTRSVNGDFLDGGFALLPRAALAPLTWYTAHAEGSVSARGVTYPFRLTWQIGRAHV